MECYPYGNVGGTVNGSGTVAIFSIENKMNIEYVECTLSVENKMNADKVHPGTSGMILLQHS
jgi:hypothetical protein